MIDRTNIDIDELEEEIRRDNLRRYSFQRMLKATDQVLWRLEEMNRDGVKTLAQPQRREVRDTLGELPPEVLEPYVDSERVQEVLDSVFDIQEKLFKLRFPDYDFDEDLAS